jgi:hypothetical protein
MAQIYHIGPPAKIGAVLGLGPAGCDKAEAICAYARQRKNSQLKIDAAELQFRAERRFGELLARQQPLDLTETHCQWVE